MNILKRIVTLIGLIALLVIVWFVFQKDVEPVTTIDFSNQIPDEEVAHLNGFITNIVMTPQGEVMLTLTVFDVIPGDSPEYVIEMIENRIQYGDPFAISTVMSIVGDDFNSYEDFVAHIKGLSVGEFQNLQTHYFNVANKKGIVSDLLSSHPSGGGLVTNQRAGVVYKVSDEVKDIMFTLSGDKISWKKLSDMCVSQNKFEGLFYVKDLSYSCGNPVKFTSQNGIITHIEMLYQS